MDLFSAVVRKNCAIERYFFNYTMYIINSIAIVTQHHTLRPKD